MDSELKKLREALAIFADVDNWKAEFVGREHRTYRVTWTGEHLEPWEIAQKALKEPQTLNQARAEQGIAPLEENGRRFWMTPTGVIYEDELEK